MALTYKVRYKNHCTPQEQILTNGRWYLDSDCGRKLAGNADTSATLSATGTLTTGVSISDSATAIPISKDFVYIKNTGGGSGNDILVTLNNSNYYIVLSDGESFASEISTSAIVKAKCASGKDSTIEYFT